MHILRSGDLVLVRRARWRIVDIRAGDRCQIATLRGASAANAGLERRFLTPFDVLEPLGRARGPRFVGNRLWCRVCRALIADARPAGALHAAHSARFDVLPHQLEPALAVTRGLATRILLADEVGLGKTIQAGIICAELLHRGACDRILILTPAGLRDQWNHELSERFAVASSAVDGPLLRRTAATLPVGVNPWRTMPIAIASFDYVKRAEVLPAVAACPWDLVIVDEAHGVCGDSDRHAAVQTLTRRASYVLLLTATPHSGDPQGFASLCDIGALDDQPLAVFRRTRADVGIGMRRRVHVLRIRASAAERQMHALLARYGETLRAERKRDRLADPLLALSVLHKRAFSSAWSLAESIDRRIAVLAAGAGQPTDHQLALPLDDPTGDLVSADEPPAWPAELCLADAARERRLLDALATAARSASRSESKLRRLDTVLRRVHEPAIVFTEYRDTLAHVCRALARRTIVLHGGLARHERTAALAEFAASPRGVLVATDAAAEGLNLHQRCRLVINLELPWNPMRLEQRIGRVDRIGQRRTVHALHLVAHETGEWRLVERLRRRLAAAASDIGVSNPLDGDDLAVARAVLGDVADERSDAGPSR